MGQPHFLAEFILESLDPAKTQGVPPLNRQMHEAAVAALWSAVKEIQRDGFTCFIRGREVSNPAVRIAKMYRDSMNRWDQELYLTAFSKPE